MEETQRQRPLILLRLCGAAAATVFAFAAQTAVAASFIDPSASLGLGTADLVSTVLNVINWALGLLGIVAVTFIIYGGYVWLTAAGNEDRVKRAKRILLNTVIGLVIIVLAWAIVNFVFDFGKNAINGTGGTSTCTAGEESGCYDCNTNGGWDYDPSNTGCTLPQGAFEIRSIVTSCKRAGDYQNDVALCSAVEIVFNQLVSTANLKEIVESPPAGQRALSVAQCTDASCATTFQPTPLFGTDPAIVYSGGSPGGTAAEFVAANKTLTFLHQHQLFPANTSFKLTVPKTVTSENGKQLSGCRTATGALLDGCTDEGDAFTWVFRVGTLNDTDPPEPVSGYPVFQGADYPDRNVNRAPILSLQFNEAIAPWTLNENTIEVRPVTGADADATHGTVGQPIAKTNYQVTSLNGVGFELRFVNGFQLDPFSWYEIRVSNLQDLCANTQQPSPLSWRFQTNGVGAGISAVYPSDGFAYACPSTEVFVVFNTSMYDPANSSCAVLPDAGGYVTGGSRLPPRTLTPMDDLPPGIPGVDFNPNDYCRQYGWTPNDAAFALAADTRYEPSVTTRYPTDDEGGTLSASWSFKTATASTCANAPVITNVAPSAGTQGACVSVLGDHFDDVAPSGQNEGDTLTFGSSAAEVKQWSQNVIVTEAPGGSTGPKAVQVTTEHPAPIGTLTSNTVDFTLLSGDRSNGPCLYSIDPASGSRGKNFSLSGSRFNPQSATKKVRFGGLLACTTNCWATDTAASANVPTDAREGETHLVSVENSEGESNALPFTVERAATGTFSALDYYPNCQGNVSCLNADIQATFSHSLNVATVSAATAELFQCPDQTCATVSAKQNAAVTYRAGSKAISFSRNGGLEQATWYRAVIHGGETGVRSENGSLLGGLNYDVDGNGSSDAVSWVFGTTADAATCALNRVQCQPSTATVPVTGTQAFTGEAYSSANQCDGSGTKLVTDDYQWSWSVNADDGEDSVSLNPHAPGAATTATGLRPTLSPVGIRAEAGGLQAQCTLSVTSASCVTDGDCSTDRTGNNCAGSVCRNNACTPVVKTLQPATGAVGDWVTLQGCYFGAYADGQSRVVFLQDDAGEDLNGLWPNPQLCGAAGSTWSNTQITVEVPNKDDAQHSVATTGPVRVIRADGEQADAPAPFDPSGQEHPGLCKVDPVAGQAGVTSVTLGGQQFGNTPGSDDVVRFFDRQSVPGSSTAWSDTTIGNVLVPSGATENPGGPEITVVRNNIESNGLAFSLIPSSCRQGCSQDGDCSGGSIQGCGNYGDYQCCVNRPAIRAKAPVTPPAVCRNAAITASFTDAEGLPVSMAQTTISSATVTLEDVTDAEHPVAVPLANFSYPTADSFAAQPGMLGRNHTYRVTIRGDGNTTDAIPEGVQSDRHVGLAGDTQWTFTTADSDNVCSIERVAVSPSSAVITQYGSTTTLTGQAYNTDGQLIAPLPGLYDWSWGWTSSNPDAVGISNDRGAGERVSETQRATAIKNGDAIVTATATGTIGWTGQRSGSAAVTVQACDVPWPARNGTQFTPYADTAPPFSSSDPVSNFSTWYCKDGADLPDVTPVAGSGNPSVTGKDELLRQFFFESATVNVKTNKKDVVGVLVWENEDRLSPAAWYAKQFNQSAPASTFQVDGYEAMRVGTTTYVAAANVAATGTVYTNMYVLGYNEDAGDDIVNIFNQMQTNFRLNVNSVPDLGYTVGETSVGADVARQQLRRDTKRLADLKEYARALGSYDAAVGIFPALASGSFIPGMSTSKWPSWTQSFAAELRTRAPDVIINNDPRNDFAPVDQTTQRACPANAEESSCWSEATKTFTCPAESHIYAYQQQSAGEAYSLYAQLEYQNPLGNWVTGSVNPCASPSTCPCFNYTQPGASTGQGVSADTQAPSLPGGFTAVALGHDRADLDWQASNDLGGSGVWYYDLYRSTDGTNYVNFTRVSHPGTSWSDAGLSPSTTYYYKIAVWDVAGNLSDRSAPVSVTTASGPDTLPPGPVTNLTTTTGDGTVTLRWTAPTDGDYAGVKIYRNDGFVTNTRNFVRTDDTLLTSVSAPGAEYADTTAENGAQYTYGLFTYDRIGNTAGSGTFAIVDLNVLGATVSTSSSADADGSAPVWRRLLASIGALLLVPARSPRAPSRHAAGGAGFCSTEPVPKETTAMKPWSFTFALLAVSF